MKVLPLLGLRRVPGVVEPLVVSITVLIETYGSWSSGALPPRFIS